MIVKIKKTGDYAAIRNATLCDNRLSFRARGILAYLLSKPVGWKANTEDLINNGPEGRDAIRTCFKEMKVLGYAFLQPVQGGGREWIICEQPDSERLKNGTSRTPENPEVLKNASYKERKKNIKKGGRRPLSDEEFIEALRTNPAYEGVNIDRELGKMRAWLLTPAGRGRQMTHRFILNWLNKADRPLKIPSPKQVQAKDVTLPAEFRKWAGEAYPGQTEDIGKMRTWADVPNWMRDEWRAKKVAPILNLAHEH